MSKVAKQKPAATLEDVEVEQEQTTTTTGDSKSYMEMIDEEDIKQQTEKAQKGSKILGNKSKKLPQFPKIEINETGQEYRKVRVPDNRYTSLKKDWEQIYTPVVEKLNLQIRMNPKQRLVELKTCKYTTDENAIQKATDFLTAYMLGFEVADCLALLRLDDIFVDSFEIKDVKTLQGDHLSRAIGRIAGKNGTVRFTIENTTKTRIVVANTKIHILGSFRNIQIARNAVVDLILGSPPGQVYNKLRVIASRMKESF